MEPWGTFVLISGSNGAPVRRVRGCFSTAGEVTREAPPERRGPSARSGPRAVEGDHGADGPGAESRQGRREGPPRRQGPTPCRRHLPSAGASAPCRRRLEPSPPEPRARGHADPVLLDEAGASLDARRSHTDSTAMPGTAAAPRAPRRGIRRGRARTGRSPSRTFAAARAQGGGRRLPVRGVGALPAPPNIARARGESLRRGRWRPPRASGRGPCVAGAGCRRPARPCGSAVHAVGRGCPPCAGLAGTRSASTGST